MAWNSAPAASVRGSGKQRLRSSRRIRLAAAPGDGKGRHKRDRRTEEQTEDGEDGAVSTSASRLS